MRLIQIYAKYLRELSPDKERPGYFTSLLETFQRLAGRTDELYFTTENMPEQPPPFSLMKLLVMIHEWERVKYYKRWPTQQLLQAVIQDTCDLFSETLEVFSLRRYAGSSLFALILITMLEMPT